MLLILRATVNILRVVRKTTLFLIPTGRPRPFPFAVIWYGLPACEIETVAPRGAPVRFQLG